MKEKGGENGRLVFRRLYLYLIDGLVATGSYNLTTEAVIAAANADSKEESGDSI